MVSFDITGLYTNIPIKIALEAVRNELRADHELSKRTKLSTGETILRIQLYMTSTVFKFEGVAIGSPLSPKVEDLFMVISERKALGEF